MTKRVPPAWQLPAIIGGCLVGIGAIGTGVVKAARYITLPEKVEAGEAKNVEQDKELYDLSRIADQNQRILDRLTPSPLSNPPAPVPPQAYDWWQNPATGEWWWCDLSTDCDQDANWWLEE